MKVMIWLAVFFGMLAPALQAQTPSPLPLVIPDTATRSIYQLSNYLSRHTASNRDFVKQLYGWITDHVAYDIANWNNPKFFYEDTVDAAVKTLQTRKAICQGYAALYYMVCRKAGIPAYVTPGAPADTAGHGWVVVKVDGAWYMTDPTWGAGFVDKGQFTKKINWNLFLVTPQEFIKTHMPFDPLWQLLEHPYRHEEFMNQRWQEAGGRPVFHFRDSLAAYERADELTRYEGTARRMEQYGLGKVLGDNNSRLRFYKESAAIIKENKRIADHNREVDAYNKENELLRKATEQWKSARDQFNRGVAFMNTYIQYKNAKFTPERPGPEIKAMLNDVAGALQQSRQELDKVNTKDAELLKYVDSLRKSQADLVKKVGEERSVVQKYLAKRAGEGK